MCKRYMCICVWVGDPEYLGAKSDHADIVSMWWLAIGHSGATLDVDPNLNVTLSEAITIYRPKSPGPHSPHNLTVMKQRGQSSQTSSSAL